MRLAIALAVIVLLVCWSGRSQHKANEALILKCGGTLAHDQVLTPTWDGGKLVAVHCNNGRRYTR